MLLYHFVIFLHSAQIPVFLCYIDFWRRVASPFDDKAAVHLQRREGGKGVREKKRHNMTIHFSCYVKKKARTNVHELLLFNLHTSVQ